MANIFLNSWVLFDDFLDSAKNRSDVRMIIDPLGVLALKPDFIVDVEACPPTPPLYLLFFGLNDFLGFENHRFGPFGPWIQCFFLLSFWSLFFCHPALLYYYNNLRQFLRI